MFATAATLKGGEGRRKGLCVGENLEKENPFAGYCCYFKRGWDWGVVCQRERAHLLAAAATFREGGRKWLCVRERERERVSPLAG